MPINFADVAELLAFACVGVFVALMFAPVWALLVGAAAFAYHGQALPTVRLKLHKPKLPRLRKAKA